MNVDAYEAERLCASVGGRLPSSSEWEWMAGGSERRLYPWGNAEPDSVRCALGAYSSEICQHPEGATPEGVMDVAGLVWQWTSSRTPGRGRVVRGGAWYSTGIQLQTSFWNAIPEESDSTTVGVRPVWDMF